MYNLKIALESPPVLTDWDSDLEGIVGMIMEQE